MKKSSITLYYSKLSHLYWLLSLLVTTVPIVTYIIMGFCQAEVEKKLTLGITVVVAIILLAVNIIMKYHLRSVVWILVLGVYFCLDNIMPLLLCVAIGTILDEFIFTPLHNSYKNKAKINVEIDRRL